MIVTGDGNIPSTYAHSLNVMKMAQGFNDIGQKVVVVTLFSLVTIIRRIYLGSINKLYGLSRKIKIDWVPIWNRDFFTKGVNAHEYHQKAADIIAKKKPNFVYCRSHLIAYHCVKNKVPTILETHVINYNDENLQKIYTVANDSSFLGLVTIHDIIAREHIKRGIPSNKLLVLPDAVDIKQFQVDDDRFFWRKKLKLPYNKKLIVYCGSLVKEKGIDVILKCASTMTGQTDILFVIIGGSRSEVDYWVEKSKEYKLKNVLFKGRVQNAKVPGYLKCADVLLMPYSKKVSYEKMDINTTSPLKLYEYMASGRPIISTNIPVIADVVPHEDAALLVEPDNIEEINRCINRLIQDKSLASKLVRSALIKANNATWTNRCQKVVDRFVNSNE